MKHKVLYLDIDGVLSTYSDFKYLLKNNFQDKENYLIYDTGHFIEKRKLNLLKDFIDKHDLSVVVVSSWVARLKSAKNVCEFLGIPYYGEPLSAAGGFQREAEIKRHVIANKVSEYLIIDDAGDKGYKIKDNVLTVNGNTGLTEKDLLKAEKLFLLKNDKLRTGVSRR